MAEDGRAGKPVVRPVPPTAEGERTLVRDISFCGVPENGSNASMVDVKDANRPYPADALFVEIPGKRSQPLEDAGAGSTFEPSLRPAARLFHRVQETRVLAGPGRYPMKRVDWDPNGERNPQNRGKSKYVRISWDEALTTIASEMNRIKEKYGPTALLYQCDQHGENKVVQACHGAAASCSPCGWYTLQIRQPTVGKAGGGQQALLGCEPVARESRATSSMTLPEQRIAAFLGVRSGNHSVGLAGQLPSRLSYWYSELGIKQSTSART